MADRTEAAGAFIGLLPRAGPILASGSPRPQLMSTGVPSTA